MRGTWKVMAMAGLLAVAFCQPGFGQAPPPAILRIDVQNFVRYVEDVVDPSKFATNSNVTAAAVPKNFGAFLAIADIVAVNDQPFKGTYTSRGRSIDLRPAPNAGDAIADTNRNALVDTRFEILNPDGTPIGSIMGLELGGGSPAPGAPLVITQGNNAIVGYTGAYLGARGYFGQTVTAQTVSTRMASMSEDPANRRTNGGGFARFVLQVIPLSTPGIAVTALGPAITHSSDFSLVTNSKPAAAGKILS